MVGGVLTLTSVGRQDSGQYICNATNVHGYSEVYTQMEVESESTTLIMNTDRARADSLPLLMMRVNCRLLHAGPPYTTCLPDQVRLQPGDALRVQCLAHGSHPIQFQWSRTGRASLPAGAEATKDGKLLIAHVKLSDSGTYKCVATNHIGSSEAQARVIIKGELVFGLRQFKAHQNN